MCKLWAEQQKRLRALRCLLHDTQSKYFKKNFFFFNHTDIYIARVRAWELECIVSGIGS